jgi:F-type H+-transporting ATPase subunit gamma
MTSPKEIKNQALSIKKIQKITDAMQKVAASKMRRAHQKMKKSMPYAEKIREVVDHVANSNTEYCHPYLQEREEIQRVGYIVVSTDQGLCGGLNINLFKLVLDHAQKFQAKDIEIDWCLFGGKVEGFFNTISANIVAHAADLGESPKIEDLVGSIKIMLDAYKEGKIDRLFIAHNEFINTMVQRPTVTQILPLPKPEDSTKIKYHWDYIYEPAPEPLLDKLMVRYAEAQIYQAVVDNIACEQVARMISMKNATTNAKELIDELQLLYNKARQASITQEISEIIGGAEAV